MFNRSGHSSTQVRKNYSEFQQKGQRFNEFNDHFEGLKVKVTQLCLTLCDPMGYTVHGILQARILEWVAFPFSRGSSQPRDLPRSSALQADSLPAEHKGGPGILKWVAYLFSSTLAWKIPWMEEPGGLPSMGSHRVGHDWIDLAVAAALNKMGLPLWLSW